ncbi:conserved exported hypothetical protein [Pseudomonas sp. 9AZ]|uniref:TonB-dependent receptor n=1 Tax=Pseudomonas sp. 9AZ TaxID=2653168 RepID=UPI0012F09FA1|nr:TonB-dependent receptor [Pseudomonas sp. 9AZ]VXC14848.1 conserved exported hypothetical protein [Pseudomonas sp. 9AZ]
MQVLRTRGRPRLSVLALALGTLLSSIPAAAEQEGAANLAQIHHISIQAQPLTDALIEFAQQSGVQVSVDTELLDGLRSSPVEGDLSAGDALQQLLRNSGIEWKLKQDVLTFHRRQEESDVLRLGSMVILGQTANPYQGEERIDRRAIENFPGANGDITSLLKMHPSVRFDTTQQSSNTPGEINPADISINGAKFYQNNFMVDGVSINNDLDPGASSATRNDYNGIYDLPSNAFGIALDADLLEEVLVYDSNVPVEYGGFNGGVVNAITRRPREGFHGKISASMTRSEWTEYHLNGDEISDEEFERSSDQSNQPEFKKLTQRVMLDGMVTENFGLIGNFVRKTSEIPVYAYEGGYVSQGDSLKREQTREIDNYMIKSFWTPNDRLDLTMSLVDAPAGGQYFKANQKNSGFVIDQGGQTVALQAVWSGDTVTYINKLSYKQVQTSRDAESNVLKSWRWSQAKNWGSPYNDDGVLSNASTSIEGGMGDLEQSQTGFEYSLKGEVQAFDILGATHRISSGLEVGYQKARYEVMEDSWTASTPYLTAANGSTSCTTASGAEDDEYCSVSINATGTAQRQYFRNLNYYRAGEIEVAQTDFAVFFQDEIQVGRLNLRPGLRLDGDDYMDKKTLAPRFAASYDLFGDQSSMLSAGLNRYYGRNLFKYRLADGRESLLSRATRGTSTGNTITDFGTLVGYGVDDTSFRRLDIPYDDEWMLGIAQKFADLRFDLKYVHRDGRDQVVRSRAKDLGLEAGDGSSTISNYFTYTNAGESSSQTVTLSITPLHNLRFAGTQTTWQLALDWSKTESNNGDYEQYLDTEKLADEDVYFNGQLLPYSELPTNNFNRPWTARLNTVTSIPQLNLTLSNFFRYRGAYEQIYQANPDTIVVDGTTYDYYQTGDVRAAPTWDARVKWEIPTADEQALYVAVDITNVTDEVNDIVSDTNGSLSYETGRQYWLEVGYTF